MRRERPTGEAASLLAAIGGVLLLISLFLAWYTLPGYTITAWTAFEVWDVVLAAIALAVLISIATDLGWWRGPAHSVSLAALGGAALVIVASQLIDRPPSALHSAVGTGGWLGLVGAGAILVGSLLAESRVTVSFNPAAPTTTPAARPAGGWAAGRRRARAAAVDPATDQRADSVAGQRADPVTGAPADAVVPATADPDATVAATARDPHATVVAPVAPRPGPPL
jgi:hypothetical protein